MIDLASLAALAAEHADDLARPVAPLLVGDRVFDTDTTPVLMGVVNLSQDSAYRESVVVSHASAVRRGRVLSAQGAALVDIGAEATSPETARRDGDEQILELVPVVRDLAAEGVLVSVEAYDAAVVAATLEAGATVVNLSGSRDDEEIFALAARHDATVLLCHVAGAHARDLDEAAGTGEAHPDPVPAMLEQFARRIETARSLGVTRLMIDPGTGFPMPSIARPLDRAAYQSMVLLHSFRLRVLGLPVCQSLPHTFPLFEDQFRTAEGMFAVLASLGRCGVVRTHEVPQVQAVLGALQVLSAHP